MGGAQTSTVNDSTALWANPAGLGVDPHLDFELFGSALATDRGNFQTSVNTLAVLAQIGRASCRERVYVLV